MTLNLILLHETIGLTRILEDCKSDYAPSGSVKDGSIRGSTGNTLNAARLLSLGSSKNPPMSTSGSRVPNSRRGDDRSESGYSMNSNVSVAESIISKSVARKGKF